MSGVQIPKRWLFFVT